MPVPVPAFVTVSGKVVAGAAVISIQLTLKLASGHRDAHELLAGREAHAGPVEVRPGLPAAGRRNREAAGLVDAAEEDPDRRGAGGLPRHAQPEVVGSGGRDVHGVLEPLARVDPARRCSRRRCPSWPRCRRPRPCGTGRRCSRCRCRCRRRPGRRCRSSRPGSASCRSPRSAHGLPLLPKVPRAGAARVEGGGDRPRRGHAHVAGRGARAGAAPAGEGGAAGRRRRQRDARPARRSSRCSRCRS